LQPTRRLAGGDALGLERLALAQARRVACEHARDPRLLAPRVGRLLEQRLRRREHGAQVARPPGVGELKAARLGAAGGEPLDVALGDLVAARPRRELLHLARELVEVV